MRLVLFLIIENPKTFDEGDKFRQVPFKTPFSVSSSWFNNFEALL